MEGFLAHFTDEEKTKASEKLNNLPKITQEPESEPRAAWVLLSTPSPQEGTVQSQAESRGERGQVRKREGAG